MLPGYNHNITYNARVFHVQTEDLGLKVQSITTHIFASGIVISMRKSSYAHVKADDTQNESIVSLMQAQHKAMMKDLVHGKFDEAIATRLPQP